MSHSFIQKPLLDNSASFTSLRMMRNLRTMCSVLKIKGKTNLSRRLQAVRNRDCWAFGNRWRRV